MTIRNSLLTALVLVAALALGTYITGFLPSPDSVWKAPIERTASMGEAVELRTFTATVTGVDGAPESVHLGTVSATSGLWVLVDLEYRAHDEPSYVGPVLESESGRRYTSLGAHVTTCPKGQPGITQTCHLLFEVPPDTLPGASLLIPSTINTIDVYDIRARVDLGITEQQVQAWQAKGKRVKTTANTPKEGS